MATSPNVCNILGVVGGAVAGTGAATGAAALTTVLSGGASGPLVPVGETDVQQSDVDF